MEDSTPKAWSLPGELRLPLDQGMLEAARRMYGDNKGAMWSHLVSTGLLVEDSLELRTNLISLLVQVDEIPISWLDHAFGVNGREAWAIAQAEPIFLFGCLDCNEQIRPKDPRHLLRLKRELEVLRDCSVGEMVSTALLCGGCTELRLHLYNEECRAARLTQQARLPDCTRWEPSTESSQSGRCGGCRRLREPDTSARRAGGATRRLTSTTIPTRTMATNGRKIS
jgi:hypothetical protein